MSERHACRVVGLSRSSVRYRDRKADDGALRERLRQLAGQRRRFGYRRLHVLLRREGTRVNHKRVYRLYREEGLAVRTDEGARRWPERPGFRSASPRAPTSGGASIS